MTVSGRWRRAPSASRVYCDPRPDPAAGSGAEVLGVFLEERLPRLFVGLFKKFIGNGLGDGLNFFGLISSVALSSLVGSANQVLIVLRGLRPALSVTPG